MQPFKEYSTWTPVRKLYYKKYYNVIRLGNFFHRDMIEIPDEFEGEYRIVDRYGSLKKDPNGNTAFASVASVYTNNADLLDFLAITYEVQAIETPVNDTHLGYLTDPNRHVIYRDKAWYDKYHHKVRVYETWRQRNISSNRKPHELMYMFDDLFKKEDSRWQGQGRDHSFLKTHSRYFSYPTIYTNNEPSIMLLKMTCNDVINIDVETVLTPEYLK